MADRVLRNPPPPAWFPDPDTVRRANLTDFMSNGAFDDYEDLWRWSVGNRAAYWEAVIERLGIVFDTPPSTMLEGTDPETAAWLPGARLNIVASCLDADPYKPALHHRRNGIIHTLTYAELTELVGRAANAFAEAGLVPGDRIAIAMPMNLEAVVAYLGVVAAGGSIVSIADSFAPEEIATRLELTGTSTVITSDRIRRAGRDLPMYEKVVEAGAASCVVVDTGAGIALRDGDQWWKGFLSDDDRLRPVPRAADAETNVLFSSGTTGAPKAIPWTQLTPLKAAADGHFHHDIHPEDVVAWPTNLGWMMGPWLIYASLLNDASLALHDDTPTGRDFGEFVAESGVTVLGVVPSLVAAWRSSSCLDGLDWSRVRLFSSTGEASKPDDMTWLMSVPGSSPVIEYCGGTEIGGGYVTGTVLQPAIAGAFSTPALGLELRILDAGGKEHHSGEVFLVPPSIGLSSRLLHRDHHEVYYADTPAPGGVMLRRHGDHMERLVGGYFQAHGRIDDTMNLGGIKVSSAEIERVVTALPEVDEVAAVAAEPPGGGPSRLVVFAVADPASVDPDELAVRMQQEIRTHLNPLFKIDQVVLVEALPRTASAKVMRRELRARLSSDG